MDPVGQRAEVLEDHLEWLSVQGYTTIDLDTLGDILDGRIEGPEKPIVITFDDADRSVLNLVAPALEQYDMQATILVVSEKVGKMEGVRIDKWLWHARFCKTRAVAQTCSIKGHIRLNGHRVEKPGTKIRADDIMTFVSGGRVVVLRVLALGERRAPAIEARTLYEIIEDA